MDDAYDDIVDDFLAELTVVKVKLIYLVLRRSNNKFVSSIRISFF